MLFCGICHVVLVWVGGERKVGCCVGMAATVPGPVYAAKQGRQAGACNCCAGGLVNRVMLTRQWFRQNLLGKGMRCGELWEPWLWCGCWTRWLRKSEAVANVVQARLVRRVVLPRCWRSSRASAHCWIAVFLDPRFS